MIHSSLSQWSLHISSLSLFCHILLHLFLYSLEILHVGILFLNSFFCKPPHFFESLTHIFSRAGNCEIWVCQIFKFRYLISIIILIKYKLERLAICQEKSWIKVNNRVGNPLSGQDHKYLKKLKTIKYKMMEVKSTKCVTHKEELSINQFNNAKERMKIKINRAI